MNKQEYKKVLEGVRKRLRQPKDDECVDARQAEMLISALQKDVCHGTCDYAAGEPCPDCVTAEMCHYAEEVGMDFNKIVLGGRFNATRIDRSTRARHLYTTYRLRAENGTNKVLQRTLWLWGQ